MHYTPHIDLAFSSLEHTIKDVNHGRVIRYIHANGASTFFIVSVLSHFSRFVLWIVRAPSTSFYGVVVF